MFRLSLIGTIMRMTAPILLAGNGALFNDRAGTTNITLEGTMLISAFFSVAASYYFGSWVMGVLAGILSGLLVALLFYTLTSVFGGDELVVGFALNILLDGLSLFLLKQIFHQSGSLISERIAGIPSVEIPWLAAIPVLGQLLTGETWIVYFSFLFALFSYVILYRTPAGLRIQACGEQPQAATTVGVDVYRIRFFCNLAAGGLCGLAGSQLSIGFLSLFTHGMTVGRGFIALGSVIFSRGNPLMLIAITLFFGLAETVSNEVQLMQLPSELVLMLPYLAVVVLTLVRFGSNRRRKSGRRKTSAGLE